MGNLFVYLFIALVLGVLTKIFIIPVSIPIILIVVFIGLSIFLKEYIALVSLLITSFLLGIYITPKLIDLKTLPKDKPIYLECKVVSFSQNYYGKSKFNCKVLSSELKNLKGRQITVISNLKPDFLSNIYALGKVKAKYGKIYLKADIPFVKEEKSKFISLVNRFRNYLIDLFKKQTLNHQSFAIGNALIFGDRSYIDKETKNAYLQTGLIHLLAISGFHIAIIFSVIFSLVSPISKRFAYTTAILFLSIFAFISGFKIPVIRASIGGIFFAISKLKGYKLNFLNLLFFIAFISVLVEPYTISSLSFQLSFLAVLGIFLVWQKFNLNNKFSDFILKCYITSIVASLFILPVLLFNFGKFSLISVLFTTPLIAVLYPYVFLEILNLITLFQIKFLVNAMDYVGVFFSNIVKWLNNFEIMITNHYVSTLYLILYYLVLFLVYILPVRLSYFVLLNILLFVFIVSV